MLNFAKLMLKEKGESSREPKTINANSDIEEAIEQARRGEEAGISLLFRTFNAQLIRYLRHQVPYDFEDVASETWLAIAKGIEKFSGNSRDFRSWMFGIARNKVGDHFRMFGRTKAAHDRERNQLVLGMSNNDLTEGPALSNISAAQAIEELVDRLAPHHAEVILLRVVADLSVEEVALITGKSPEAVRVIQHRALRSLVNTKKRKIVT